MDSEIADKNEAARATLRACCNMDDQVVGVVVLFDSGARHAFIDRDELGTILIRTDE